MYSFEYAVASDQNDAVRQARSGETQFLAGGQTLLGAMKLRLAAPEKLVDLSRLDALRGIERTADGLRIGALATHAAVAAHAMVRESIPALAYLAANIGDRQVRNLGTLGGSLANNDPAACYPAAALGLAATIHTDRRDIPADAFFRGMFTTALEPGELICAVTFPVPSAAAYEKFKQRASRFAIVGVFVARSQNDVRVAVTGAGLGVFRADAFERALAQDFSAAALDGLSISHEGLNEDLHASALYRAHLVKVLTARAVARAR